MPKFNKGDLVAIKSIGLGAEVTDASRPDGLVEVRIAEISIQRSRMITDIRLETFPPDDLEIINKRSGLVIL